MFFDLIDGAFFRLWSPVIHFWCWLTGRSTFTLARGCIRIGSFWVVFSLVLAMALNPDVITVLLASTMIAVLSVLSIWCLRLSRRLEEALDNGSDVLPMTLLEMENLVFWRTLHMVIGILWLVNGDPFLLVYSFGLYALTHVHGRRRSVFGRIVDAVRRRLPQLGPAPLPQPG